MGARGLGWSKPARDTVSELEHQLTPDFGAAGHVLLPSYPPALPTSAAPAFQVAQGALLL